MGKPENTFRKIRFLSIALALIGLAACGGSGDSVNSASQTVSNQGNSSTTESPGDIQSAVDTTAGNNSNALPEILPFCTLPGSDADGDGFGFENGNSCRAAG